MPRSTHPENEQNFGEPIKYDPDFHGPLRGRSCTDILCLLLFVVFIACWIGIGVFAFCKGDPDSLLIPKDSSGKRCGHDSDVMDRPFLFFIDITKCLSPTVLLDGCKTKQVCVKKCPDTTYVQEMYPKNPKAQADAVRPFCDARPENVNENTVEHLTTSGDCPKWYAKSNAVLNNRCLPDIDFIKDHFDDLQKIASLDDIQKAIKNVKALAQAEEMIVAITEDVRSSWWQVLIGLAASLVVCFIYIYLMRWVASWVVWFSLLGVLAVLSYGTYYTADRYVAIKDQAKKDVEWTIKGIQEQPYVWLTLLIVFGVLLALTLLILIFLRKRIVIAISLIKEGSKAVGACISSLFFPIFPWILQILLIAFAVTSGLFLASVGESIYQVKNMTDSCHCKTQYTDGGSCDPSHFSTDCSGTINLYNTANDACGTCSLAYIRNPPYIRFFHAVNIVGGFWSVFFISAFGEMVLAATFATWYWTFKKSKVPFFTVTHSIGQTLRYHVGTLAFGSLIITICRLIRIAIEYVDHKLKKYDNQIVKAIICCCRCFFWCLEKFLKFINRNAYIMCAIHGKNFCTSAKDAFSLLMRNILRVFVLDKVTDLLFFLGKILITVCVGTVAYTVFNDEKYISKHELHYALVPVILISIGAFFISNVFFGVYAMAVDTLFLCFLEDCERNDGSPEKPYFMSKQLMAVLGKKNKGPKRSKKDK